MKKFLLYLLSLSLFPACDNISLTRSESQIAFASQVPDGSFCSRPAEMAAGLLKVVFVLDMSLSNIGEFKKVGSKIVFDRGPATDRDGIRFQKVQDFIEKCGSKNLKNTFKIVGFSGSTLKANPAVSGCGAGFENKQQALSSLSSLRQLQKYNNDNIDFNDFKASMQTTSYQDGLECAKNILADDINANPVEAKNSNYQIFFLTDGQATDNCPENTYIGNFRDDNGTCCPGGAILDSSGVCCAPGVIATKDFSFMGTFIQTLCCSVGDRRSETNRCEADPDYADKISRPSNPQYETLVKSMMLKGLQKASTIKLQTIYYGDQNEQSQAVKLLDRIAQWGGSDRTIAINNVEKVDFCQYANSPIQTEYQTSEFNIVNLTAVVKDQRLLADSDMDGVPDKDDPNPTNARSNSAELLDGVCKMLNGDFNCKKPATCRKEKLTPLRLNECDQAALSIAGSDGLDYDQDRIPDYIEILRSTLPNSNDAFNNLDGDSMNNLQEIHVGRQVDAPDDAISEKILQHWSIARMTNDDMCPVNQKQYQIKLNQLATVPTEKYTDPDDGKDGALLKFSHAKNENVFLVYYFSEPLNNKSMPTELFAAIIKIPYGSNDFSKIILNSKSFIKLGSVDGKPKW